MQVNIDRLTVVLSLLKRDDVRGWWHTSGIASGTLPGQTNEEGNDAFIRKYNADGDEEWTRQFGTSEFDAAGGVSLQTHQVVCMWLASHLAYFRARQM